MVEARGLIRHFKELIWRRPRRIGDITYHMSRAFTVVPTTGSGYDHYAARDLLLLKPESMIRRSYA